MQNRFLSFLWVAMTLSQAPWKSTLALELVHLVDRTQVDRHMSSRFLSAEQLKKYEVEIIHGLFVYKLSRLPVHHDLFSTLNYVMSADQKLYVAQRHEVLHHSDFLKGAPVLGAGEMIIRSGQLRYLSNQSGHYRPNAEVLLQTKKLLEAQGVLFHRVKLYTLDERKQPKIEPSLSRVSAQEVSARSQQKEVGDQSHTAQLSNDQSKSGSMIKNFTSSSSRETVYGVYQFSGSRTDESESEVQALSNEGLRVEPSQDFRSADPKKNPLLYPYDFEWIKTEDQIFLESSSCETLLSERRAYLELLKTRGWRSLIKTLPSDSCIQSDSGFRVELTSVLTPTMRQLHGFVPALIGAFRGPNCWNATLLESGLTDVQDHTDASVFAFSLEKFCTQRGLDSGDQQWPKPGDIGRIRGWDAQGRLEEIHGFTYIANTVFSKNGNYAPYELQPIEKIIKIYDVPDRPDCLRASGVLSQCKRFIEYYHCSKIRE